MTKRTAMGEVFAQVTLIGPAGRRRIRLLVDTGSTYTWIRADRLRGLGIRPLTEYDFETIEKDVRRPIGEAIVDHKGEARTTVVVFGKTRDGQVLGLHALEGLGLEVDPVNRRLRRRAAILAM